MVRGCGLSGDRADGNSNIRSRIRKQFARKLQRWLACTPRQLQVDEFKRCRPKQAVILTQVADIDSQLVIWTLC